VEINLAIIAICLPAISRLFGGTSITAHAKIYQRGNRSGDMSSTTKLKSFSQGHLPLNLIKVNRSIVAESKEIDTESFIPPPIPEDHHDMAGRRGFPTIRNKLSSKARYHKI
jgi:hypothetical protein